VLNVADHQRCNIDDLFQARGVVGFNTTDGSSIQDDMLQEAGFSLHVA